MVAVLTRFLGLHHLQLAKDVMQESFIKALQTWQLNGPPDNAEAWLLQVAKNKAIDVLCRQDLHNRFSKEQVLELTETADEFFHEQEIADSQLRLIFACCHPSIKQEDRVVLTLQMVSAFSVPEIARALLKNETVEQYYQSERIPHTRTTTHTLFGKKKIITVAVGRFVEDEKLNSSHFFIPPHCCAKEGNGFYFSVLHSYK